MAKIAVVQAGTYLLNPEKTLAQMQELTAQAANQGAALVLFPETYIGGYPKGLDFGASVGIRTSEGRHIFAEYANQAIEIGDKTCAAIGAIAKRHKLTLVTGVLEKQGGTLYCSSFTFSAEGELIANRRKLIPTAAERVIWGQGDGSGLSPAITPLGKVNSVICWENYMPLLRMAVYNEGVDIYCAPTVDDRDAWQPTIRHIAREGRCYLLSACQYLTREHFPAHWLETTHYLPETPIRGGSAIISPMGEYLAEPVYDKTAILIADYDPQEITKGRYDLDVTGHYQRADLFGLTYPL